MTGSAGHPITCLLYLQVTGPAGYPVTCRPVLAVPAGDPRHVPLPPAGPGLPQARAAGPVAAVLVHQDLLLVILPEGPLREGLQDVAAQALDVQCVLSSVQ